MQTLATLDLAHNDITSKGSRYLSDALKHNRVGLLFSCRWLLTFVCSFIQTLTTLYFMQNIIGHEGAQHLSTALKENVVGD